MKILLLAIIVLISACSGGSGSNETVTAESGKRVICSGTAYYGDSIGGQVEESGLLPGFNFHNTSGIVITGEGKQGNGLPIPVSRSYCIIYIALGTNQADTPELTRDALLVMIDGIEDRVTCVLPMTIHGELVEPSRSVLKEYCPRYIDPIQLGIYPLSDDGVHLDRMGGENVAHYVSMFL